MEIRQVRMGKSTNKQELFRKSLRMNGKQIDYGIGSHANSVIHYELPKGHDFIELRLSEESIMVGRNNARVKRAA